MPPSTLILTFLQEDTKNVPQFITLIQLLGDPLARPPFQKFLAWSLQTCSSVNSWYSYSKIAYELELNTKSLSRNLSYMQLQSMT